MVKHPPMTDESIYGYKDGQFIHKKDGLALNSPVEIQMDEMISSPSGRGLAYALRFVVGTMKRRKVSRLVIAIWGDVHHVSLSEQNEDELLAILTKRRNIRQQRSMQ